MTDKKKKALLIFALFAVIIAVSFAVARRGQFYEVALFRSGDGWGYDIVRNEKVYIHQPFMPAVEGEEPFKDKKTARLTGRLVVKKIRKHQLPAINKEEIKSIIGD